MSFKVGDKVIMLDDSPMDSYKKGDVGVIVTTDEKRKLACINFGGCVLDWASSYNFVVKQKFKYPKVMVLGYGRHGKDTVGDILGDFGYNITSSSFFAANKFIFNSLKDVCGYKTVQECFDDRHNKRVLWYELIKAYNKHEPSRLAHEMLKDGFDVYVGLRDDVELQDVKDKGLYDLIVWVDATERLGGLIESEDSCKVTADMCDVVIENNGTLDDLRQKVIEIFELSKDF